VDLLLFLSEFRDVVIIIVGVLTILLVLAMLIFTVAIGIASRMLLGALNRLVKDDASPLVRDLKETAGKARGTASFVSEAAVRPIIRTYGVVAGTRRAMGVLTGLAARRNGRRPADDDSITEKE
jgi:hypothetical protein